jgi:hypothetical protein
MDRSTDETGAPFERQSARRHLELARAELRLLDAVIPGRLKTVMQELDEADRLLASSDDASAPKRMGCPFCGKQIMANATLCGFCWRKLDSAVHS